MERQSTSKLYRALIAVVAFFVLCTSAILFASCGTDPRECKHEHLDESDVIAYELATCGTPGTVTYECSDCGAAVTVIGTLATGEHNWANGKCTFCGIAEGSQGLSLKEVKDLFATLATQESMLATQKSLEQLTTLVNKLATQDSVDKLASQESIKELKDLVDKLASQESVDKLASQESIKELKDLVDKLATPEDIDELTQAKFEEIGKELTDLKAGLSELQSNIVGALTDGDCTLPSLDAKLEQVLENLKGLGDLDIDLGDFDISGLSFLATAEEEKVTLADVITALYKQVHQLFIDCSSASESSLYNLLVSADGTHVHNWVLKLKAGTTESCTAPNTYVWGCAFCNEVKSGVAEVKVNPTGHVTEFKSGLKDAAHHFDATCITGERVEGKCAVCGEWTGEWTTVGVGTGKHNYVLEAEHSKTGSCTQVGTLVYHCATCGGAYVEETPARGHNYYYELDGEGNKVELTPERKEQLLKDYFGAKQDLSKLTEEQKAEALQPYLNIVYSSDATCVDPGLVVVECLECGVRYSYTTGEEPTGHHFVAHAQVDNTCTTDGTAGYAYCWKCGYFFIYDGKAVSDDVGSGDGPITQAVGAHSRNYIRKDGKVIHYVLPGIEEMTEAQKNAEPAPVAVDPAELKDGKNAAGVTVDPALTNLYEVISSVLPAKGHHYVPVYTNTAKCVTAQQYILVCDKCFGEYDETTGALKDEHNFDYYTLKFTRAKEGDSWTPDSGNTSKTEEVLFASYTTGAGDKATTYYALACLTGKNLEDLAAKGVVDEALATIVDMKKWDDTNKTEGTTVTTVQSDITEDWLAVQGDKAKMIDFFVEHQGYLERDVNDDDKFALGEDNEADLRAQLENLDETALEALYMAYNVVVEEVEDAEAEDDEPVYQATPFVDPVVGHKFTEKYVTVVGSCVMYERHVLFCTVCGQKAGSNGSNDAENKSKVVDKATDDNTFAEDEKYNDLQKSWEAVLASMPEAGSGLIDDEDAPTVNWTLEGAMTYVFPWLVQYGYLNDLRDGDLNKAPDDDELTRIGYRIGELYSAKYEEAIADTVKGFDAAKFEEEFWTGFYTQKNVLNEYKVTSKLSATENDTPIVLGHEFDVVAYAGVGETCDSPAFYVYVCSKCGLAAGAETSELKFQNGKDSAEFPPAVGIIDEPNYKTDANIVNKSVPTGMDAKGKLYENSDLQLEWAALETENDQFNWLLEKGYLNGVIDSVMLFGYTTTTGHVNGALENAIAENLKLEESEQKTLKELFAVTKSGVSSGVYYDFYEVTSHKASDKKDAPVIWERTFIGNKDTIKQAATAIALYAKYVKGTVADLGKFYTQSGDLEGNAALSGKPANKTSDVAKVLIPSSGHLWTDDKGKPIDIDPETGDPLCSDFASKKFTDWLNPDDLDSEEHYYAVWQEADPEKKVEEGWIKGEKIENFKVLVNGNEVYKKFIENASKYGVLAACKRSASCPLCGTDASPTEQYAFGYYAACDHVTSYEKYAASSEFYPTNKVELTKGGDHIYYNYDLVDAYVSPDKAGLYLEGGDTWELLMANAGSGTPATQKAALEKINAAAQKAMDADLRNLATLQKYWNTLFVSENWLEAADITDEAKKETTSAQRKKDYPTIELDASLLTGDEVNYTALKALFDAAGVTPLWREDRVTGEIVSNWRPLSDLSMQVKDAEGEVIDTVKAPSCWVDLRCQWYHVQGTLCTNGSPNVAHVYPSRQEQNKDEKIELWYGRTEKLANCQHKDRCMTCGQEIGKTIGEHTPVDVTKLTDNHAKLAWIAVLNAAKGVASSSKITFLKDVQAAVWFADEVTLENYDEAWGLKDDCFDNVKAYGPIYVCTGELEIIYNDITFHAGHETWDNEPAEGGITWQKKDATTHKDDGTWNYNIEQASAVTPHGWATGGDGNYTSKFYYATNFYVNGELVGSAGNEIMVDANGTPVKEGGEAATREQILFSSIPCTAGYTEKQFCNHKVDHTFTTGSGTSAKTYTKGEPCGAENSTAITVDAKGHTLAPVLGYDTLTSARYEKTTSKDNNSKVTQVCVYCGMHTYGEYMGTTEAATADMYNLASESEIEAWNKVAEEWNAAHPTEDKLWLAEGIKDKDIGENLGDADATIETAFESGTKFYKENVNLTLGKTTGSNAQHVEVPAGADVTLRVAPGKELTFQEGNTHGVILDVKGTLAIVGELTTDGEATSKVDLSALDEIWTNGGNLILKNIEVTLGNSSINPGPGLNGTGKGGAIELSGAVVTSTGPVFGMNSGATAGRNVITIDNSTLLSTGDTALAIYKSNVEVIATDSVFAGKWAGALIRSGKATFTDCTFATVSGEKYSSETDWQSGSDVPVDAALIVGNTNAEGTGNVAYGNAKVYVYGGTFGTITSTSSFNKASIVEGEFSDTTYAIAAFSSKNNETWLTVDAKSVISAGEEAISINGGERQAKDEEGNPVWEGEGEEKTAVMESTMHYKVLTPTAKELGETAEEQVKAAGSLVESVLASGGEVELPTITGEDGDLVPIDYTEEGNPLTVGKGKSASVDLGGNVVNVQSNGKGFEGDLTIKNGTIDGTKSTGVDFGVKAGSTLTLSDVDAKFSADGGICVVGQEADGTPAGKVVIEDSKIIGVQQVVVTNNKDTTNADITITNSQILAMGTDAGYATALLINAEGVKLTATNSKFYGVSNAVWVRAGEATFTDCDFVSGGKQATSNNWTQGNGIKTEAVAALVVGDVLTWSADSDTKSYGNARVTINGTSSAIRGKYEADGEDNTITFNEDGTLNTYSDSTAKGDVKRFVVASDANDSTTVIFENKTVSDRFLMATVMVDGENSKTIEGLVKDENVFYPDNEGMVDVKYVITPAVPPTTPEGEDGKDAVYGNVKINIPVTASRTADKALKDAAQSGGVVEIPAGEVATKVTFGADVLTDGKLRVKDNKSLEIQLGANVTLNLESNTIVAGDGANVTIQGGTIETNYSDTNAQMITKDGEGSVTLKDVTVKGTGKCGVAFAPQAAGGQTDIKGSVWTIENSVIYNVRTNDNKGTGIWVNGLVDGKATLNITNSVVIGGETGLEVAGDVEVNATRSTFYGGSAAVQLNSGTSTFANCIFIGACQACDSAFNGGNGYPDELEAIFVIAAKGGGYGESVTATLNGCQFVYASGTLNAVSGEGTEIVAGTVKSGVKYTVPATTDGLKKVTLTAVGNTTINFTVDTSTAGAIGRLDKNVNVYAYTNKTTSNPGVTLDALKGAVKTNGIAITEQIVEP